eukprot:Skav230169  [mRNA]  locus=scaffold996:200677:200913:- [translate_table: standard]
MCLLVFFDPSLPMFVASFWSSRWRSQFWDDEPLCVSQCGYLEMLLVSGYVCLPEAALTLVPESRFSADAEDMFQGNGD